MIEKSLDDIMNDTKPVITIMTDYSAWGLWINGAATDIDDLGQEANFPKEFIEKMRPALERWQNEYEEFNLYTSQEESDKVYASDEFYRFEELGRWIYNQFKDLDQDDYIIEYFDERLAERYRGAKFESDDAD